ncbi:pilus assembly protein TadG-related protein [Sphingomonas bacterium]|uniref:pilus assembly protein TadG-related protein n=1 Tax=Sphingomonas bacterium TaxID=1895847 RepID=UPI001575A3BA|nr:pilus assembly protein TadG-related protein [Sphingomonas bacterium]
MKSRYPFLRVVSRIAHAWTALRADRRGSVFMILGFALIPLTLSVGIGIDYARAARIQTRLNAIADAAALATVTAPMMQQTPYNAAVTAYNMWHQQADATAGLVTPYFTGCCVINQTSNTVNGGDGTLLISVTDTNTTGHTRTTTVSWHAASHNAFGNLLAMAQIELNGTSTTNAKQAPNIDFYVLLDTSSSMAFPTTTAGINQLGSLTGGCTFACHNTNYTQATKKDGTKGDYYSVALSYGIPLRVDQARLAVQSMMTTATQTEQNNNAQYRAALASFGSGDSRAPNPFNKLLFPVTAALSSVSAAANGAQVTNYYSENQATSTYPSNDTDTWSSDAFTRINSLMPAPGNGTNQAGDKPQQIMFIITDGMRDEYRPGGRPEVAFDTTLCDTIKARGIRIGIIYTEYLPSAINTDPTGWSQVNVVPYLPQVEPALQNCASSGLYYKVSTNDDISTALNQLFQAAVATAHIAH